MQAAKAPNFGRYKILAEIGRGAMGVVYKAHDPTIDRTVALKTIILSERHSAEEKEFRERFLVEARAAGRLSHPAIVTIYDVGQSAENQDPFIVMEYVEGESLEKQLSDLGGEFPPECALVLVRELACALDYAHSQGIVHRDIKPANIIVGKDGRAKITDFGVAKLNTAYQTVAGQSLGTPAYMSPEQLNGDAVDGRSDLFSLGVILYTLLTGHRPFQGNSAMTVSFRVVHREPLPVSAFDSGFPPDVDYVIGRAIAKDPANRYQTGQEMADDLADLQEGRAPRSKDNESPAPEKSAEQPLPAHAVIATQRFAPLKPATSPSPSARNARRVATWEYAMFVVLAAGVVAMSVALFRPTAPPQLVRDALHAPPRANAMSGSGGTRETARESTKSTLSPTSSSSADIRSSAGTSEPKLVVASGTAGSAATAATPVSSNKQTASSPAIGTRPMASLHIRLEHRFPAAQVLVWVDDKLAYKESADGTVKRRMRMFKTVEGYKSGSVQLASGEHRIRVRVQSADNSYDRTGTIAAVVPEEGERQLKIDCTNRKQIHLAIE
jgi:eukaryotic-like serine/threonine-protein kinase